MPLTHGVSRSTWYILVVVYLSMFALALASMLWSSHVADQSNRRWCGILSAYHKAYVSNPGPTTPAGRDIRNQMEQLYSDFRCDTVKQP